MRSPHVAVHIDLARVRQNTAAVAARAGVPVWATIKADAYGLGAARVVTAIADLVEGFCVFALEEATSIDLWRLTGKPAVALGPPATLDPAPWLAAHVRPAVSTVAQARALAEAGPVLCVDTGMQRFACPPEQIDEILEAGGIEEAFTHATRLEHADRLRELTAGRQLKLHAAASSLLNEPTALLDAVRPGLALYLGAVTVITPLAEARPSAGPIGYTGWRNQAARHGVILIGYSQGLRPGPCLVNDRPQRVTEVGMQSAYVTLDESDRPGDPVTLLGGPLTEADVAFAWGTSPHHAMLTLTGAGTRNYFA